MPESSSSEGIRVFVRLRPLSDQEKTVGHKTDYDCVDGCSVVQLSEPKHAYEFDKVFDGRTSTEAVYGMLGQRIVTGVSEGINGTLFAYGQTSSGKY
jgi:Kinesin motor domain